LVRVVCVLWTAACAGRAKPEPAAEPRIAIIVAERGPQGARLVAIDERGDRQFDLLEVSETLARDSHPALSPDGAWVVFASSRGRPLDETSVWIAPMAPQAVPHRLTTDAALESHTVWTRDGRAIVFASTRAGGDFDLVSLAVERGRPVGEPAALTSADGHEVTPATSADGSVLYAAITPREGGEVESRIEARAPDGTIAVVTQGPADGSPAVSPDEATLAFSRPVPHESGLDAELWTMPRNGGPESATVLVDLPLTDESGPVWSHDGRYLFATSVLRGAQGNAVFSSVIVIDTRERPMKARMLEDRAGAIARLTPAIGHTTLDASALRADPEYLPELARIMAAAMAQPAEPEPR
jgi:Tol biopolymer transport system component